MERRRHARLDHWRTLGAPRKVGKVILDIAVEQRFAAVLVDCLTLLTSNLLMDAEEVFAGAVEEDLMSEVKDQKRLMRHRESAVAAAPLSC